MVNIFPSFSCFGYRTFWHKENFHSCVIKFIAQSLYVFIVCFLSFGKTCFTPRLALLSSNGLGFEGGKGCGLTQRRRRKGFRDSKLMQWWGWCCQKQGLANRNWISSVYGKQTWRRNYIGVGPWRLGCEAWYWFVKQEIETHASLPQKGITDGKRALFNNEFTRSCTDAGSQKSRDAVSAIQAPGDDTK